MLVRFSRINMNCSKIRGHLQYFVEKTSQLKYPCVMENTTVFKLGQFIFAQVNADNIKAKYANARQSFHGVSLPAATKLGLR